MNWMVVLFHDAVIPALRAIRGDYRLRAGSAGTSLPRTKTLLGNF
jgi:hypothetical protein